MIIHYALEDDSVDHDKCDIGSAEDIAATVLGCTLAYIIPNGIMIYLAVHSVYILLNMNNMSKPKSKPPTAVNNMTNPSNKNESMTSSTNNMYSMDASNVSSSEERRIKFQIPEHSNSTNKKERSIMGTIKSRSKKISSANQLSDFQWIATFNTILAVTFVVNVFPFGVIAVVRAICTDCITQHWWHFAHLMCYLNSALNPICYAFGNKNFKKAFRSILCKSTVQNHDTRDASFVTEQST